MSEEKTTQSLSISGGEVSNVQIGGLAGRDLNVSQTQQISEGVSTQSLTQANVIDLIAQIEELFRSSNLLEDHKTKAIKHLETAKEEVQGTSPDKDFAAKSLQRAAKILKEANETVTAGTNLWSKVQPILSQILPWLGVAANFFG
jgi:hypothetical protein